MESGRPAVFLAGRDAGGYLAAAWPARTPEPRGRLSRAGASRSQGGEDLPRNGVDSLDAVLIARSAVAQDRENIVTATAGDPADAVDLPSAVRQRQPAILQRDSDARGNAAGDPPRLARLDVFHQVQAVFAIVAGQQRVGIR